MATGQLFIAAPLLPLASAVERSEKFRPHAPLMVRCFDGTPFASVGGKTSHIARWRFEEAPTPIRLAASRFSSGSHAHREPLLYYPLSQGGFFFC